MLRIRFDLEPILKNLKENKNDLIRGLAAVAIIEIMLLVVFFISINSKSELVLDKSNPTIIAAYTMNFVHKDIEHLAGNLFSFAFISFITLFILSLSGKVRFFYKILTINLILMPILVSIVWLFLSSPQLQRTMGFSAIVASFFGSFILLYIRDFMRRIKIYLDLSHVRNWIAGLIASMLAFVYLPYHKNIIMLGIPLAVAILFYVLTIKSMKSSNERFSTRKSILLVSSAFVLVPLLSDALFPLNIGNTDVLNHYTGFLFGFLVSSVYSLE